MACRAIAIVLMLFLLPGWSSAAWHDGDAQFRRGLLLDMPANKISADQLVSARVLLNGKQLTDAADLRILTEQGKPVVYCILAPAQGDSIEVIFNAAAGVREYHAYFGAKNARKSPEGTINHGGLLLELKGGGGGASGDAEQLKQAWARAGRVIGQRTISRVHLGNNLMGHNAPSMTRITGNLFAPLDGNYIFAVAGDDRSALWIDGKARVFARHPVNDARFQEKVELKRGWHEVDVYHADLGGDYRLGVYWQRPDTQKLDVIGNEFFGPLAQASAQPLEQKDQPVTADMTATYLGESFYANRFSHRYRFDVASTIPNKERLQVKWQFSDGRSLSGQQFEHVFLNTGVYEVKVEVKAGANTDTQTFRLRADRDYERADKPAIDELALHARLVASYEFSQLKSEALAQGLMMFLRAGQEDQAYKAGKALLALKEHPNRPTALEAITELRLRAVEQGRPERMLDVYAAAPRDSQLQPQLATDHALLLMYANADFAGAAAVLSRLASKDPSARRGEAQAALLSGDLEKARRIFAELPVNASEQKAQALSGAMARTTEFHIRERDLEEAEESWQKWMATFPADFLEGNAALLRVELIAAQKRPLVAAKVAEAYANANPQSAYSPRLLHEAAKLLEGTDKTRAEELRSLLKQRYPEDPLSQGN